MENENDMHSHADAISLRVKSQINFKMLFDSLYHNTGELAILVLDTSGEIVDNNEAAASFLGGGDDDSLSINLRKILNPIVGNDFLNIEKLLKEGIGESNFEAELPKSKDRASWANVIIRRVQNEQRETVGYILFIRDITEKVMSDKTIRSIAKYPEENPLPVLRISADGEIIYSNAASRPLMEMLHCAETMKVPEDMFKTIKGSLESRQNMTFEMSMNNRDLLFTIVPIRTYVNLYGTDITELKIKENELMKAKERIEKSDKLKSEFLARMSHEIRTPLNVIISNASIIKDELSENLDDEISMMLDIMQDDGKRLMRTVQMILDASQIETGTLNVESKRLDFHKDVMEKIVGQYKELAETKGLKFNYTNISSKTEVSGDLYVLSQAVDQLLNNAVKFTNKGSVDIKLHDLDSGNLSLDVTDSGIGISEEFKNEMFDWFSTEEKGYARNYEGNGLGLALAKRFCDLNNIQIDVRSQKGNGSTFSLIFRQ